MRLKDLDDQWLIKLHFFGIYEETEEERGEWRAGEVYIPDPQRPDRWLPKSVIQAGIDSAVAEFEKKISASIRHREQIAELHDYDRDLYNNYVYVVLRRYPLVRIHSFQLVYGTSGQVIWDIPSDAIQIKEVGAKFGTVQVLPQWGTNEMVDPAYATLFPQLYNAHSAPNMIKVTYDAGMDGLEEDLEDDLVRAISLRAAIHVFNILGDIVLGAGIASVSVSVDGLSQSINTTSSAENSAYSARIIMHRKELMGEQGVPGLLQDLIKEWRRPPLGLL